MTKNETALLAVNSELETIESRSAAILAGDLTDDLDSELKELAGNKRKLLERRSSIRTLIDDESKDQVINVNQGPMPVDCETRERLELRSKARLTDFIQASLSGNPVSGASREYRSSFQIEQGIPIDLFESERIETRADSATPIPSSNTGVNLRPVMPSIFARSVLPRFGVAMPQVGSGAYSIPVITTDLAAAAVAKGADRDSTAGAITAKSTTPHRVSTRLTIQIEDVAAFGNDTFESALRQNLMLALSHQLDNLGLTGDNTGANPQGLLSQLTDPDDPSNVVDFDGFVALAADGIDGGPWAESMKDVRLLVNADTMKLAEKSFRDKEIDEDTTNEARAAIALGETSAAMYLRENCGGLVSSSRMPDTASDIAQVLRYRAGTMGLDGVNATETATCPVWNYLSIDDPYSDSAAGQRHISIHALIGDVIINYLNAYQRVDLKVS